MKARPIMIQGTMSNAGKSLTAAALCRALKQEGYRVAPFKSQNMALNSYVTKDGFEMGRAQVVQAEAAGKEADVRMNPVLLKPTTDVGAIMEAYEGLAAENDVIVIEGAGSPVELNLNDNDIVNMGLAEKLSAPVLLVGDIDRGGIFAQLCGTVSLLSDRERALVKGLLVNKFRGDVSLFAEGAKMLERLSGKPVLGVVPYFSLDIDDEGQGRGRRRRRHAAAQTFELHRLCALRAGEGLFGALRFPRFRVRRARPHHPPRHQEHDRGLAVFEVGRARRADRGGGAPRRARVRRVRRVLSDPFGCECGGEEEGLGLLPLETVFGREKCLRETQGTIGGLSGVFSCLNGQNYTGYEIHMGQSGEHAAVVNSGCVYGTYVHGVFDDAGVAAKMIAALGGAPAENEDARAVKERNYEELAKLFRASVDMQKIKEIIEHGI